MKEIALMFSGGLDTTYASFQLLEEYERLHLLTFDSGRMLAVERFSTKNVRLLQERFGPERILHRIVSTRDFLDLQLRDLLPTLKRYRSPGVICSSCQFAMDVKTVQYCLEHGIPQATDGKSRAQTEVCLQTLDYCRTIRRFMAGFGVDYLLPTAHEITREEKREFLRREGLFSGVPLLTMLQRTGLNNFSDFLGRQPLCYLAVAPFVLTSPLRHVPPFKYAVLSLEAAEEYRRLREPLAQEYLRRFFADRGEDLDARIAALRALPAGAA